MSKSDQEIRAMGVLDVIAFRNGYNACRGHGYASISCPYPHKTQASSDWWAGQQDFVDCAPDQEISGPVSRSRGWNPPTLR